MASMFKLTSGTATFEVKDTAGVCSIELDGASLPDPAETAVLDGVTAGTVTASKAVVVDSNKDIGDFRNLDAVNFDAGSSGVAGTVDIFPTTAAKGRLRFVTADNTGDTVTAVGPSAQAGARTYSIPDAGGNADFVMNAGAQTVAGVKTFSSGVAFGAASTLDLDSAAVAATGNDTTQTATVTKMAGVVTTGALTTAANNTTDVVLTLTGVAAGDLVFVTLNGGNNTASVDVFSATCTTNTITVKLRNVSAGALNGTVGFSYLWCKA
jgi:hypothetical protein